MKLAIDTKRLKWYGLFFDTSPRLESLKGLDGVAILDYDGPASEKYYEYWVDKDGKLIHLSEIECDRWLVKKDFSLLKAIPLFDSQLEFDPEEWLYIEGKQYSELETELRSRLINDYKRDVLTAMRIITRRYFSRFIDDLSLEMMRKELTNQEVDEEDINRYVGLCNEVEELRARYIQCKQAILDTNDPLRISCIFNYMKIRVGYNRVKVLGRVHRPVKWEGVWLEGKTYPVGSCIEHSGSLWRCLRRHVSSSDNEPPSDVWDLVFEVSW